MTVFWLRSTFNRLKTQSNLWVGISMFIILLLFSTRNVELLLLLGTKQLFNLQFL